MSVNVASTHNRKYKYKYEYSSLYKYKYKYKYYKKFVLKSNSSTSTSTQYYISAEVWVLKKLTFCGSIRGMPVQRPRCPASGLHGRNLLLCRCTDFLV
jgi:hypothetical protein